MKTLGLSFLLGAAFVACSGYDGGGDVLVAGGVADAGGGGTPTSDSGAPRLDAGGSDARSDAAPPEQSSVIAYYPLDSDGSDASPRNGDLLLNVNNGTFTTGRVAKALGLVVNGVAAARSKSDPELAFGANDFTVQAWMRTTSSTLGLGTRQLGVSATDGWLLSMTPTAVGFQTNDPRGALAVGSLTAGQFHHVVVRRSAGVVDLFVDGSKRGTRSSWPEIGQERVFAIGQAPASNTPSSLVDEVVIWSRAITDTEIQSNFTRGSNGQAVLLTQ